MICSHLVSLRLLVVASATLLSSCVPTIVMIDRPTLIEEESAGEWPDFEKQILKQSFNFEPVPLPSAKLNRRNERVYNSLEGEYQLTPKIPAQ